MARRLGLAFYLPTTAFSTTVCVHDHKLERQDNQCYSTDVEMNSAVDFVWQMLQRHWYSTAQRHGTGVE